MKSLTLGQIARLVGCAPPADAGRTITGVNTLDEAGESELSFLSTDAFARQFAGTRAAAVLVQRSVTVPPDARPIVLLVDDADLAMVKVLEAMAPPVPRPPAGVDALARVAADAVVGCNVAIGPFVYVGAGARIGDNSVLHPGVHIGDHSVVGEDCELFANVVVRERCILGQRVIIHAGSVIGSDGFGYRWDGQRHAKVPQIGQVVVEDDVEIGSCVCIDRAKFSRTVIGRGTKIDNLIQIAHNVRIGAHCIIAAQAGLAGSATLGNRVAIGGQTAVRDHVTVGDRVQIAACSGVAGDVPANTIVSGLPALPHRRWLREQAAMRRLPDLVAQVRAIQEQLKGLGGK